MEPSRSRPSRRGEVEDVVVLDKPCDPSWFGAMADEVVSSFAGRRPEDLAIELRRRVASLNRVPVETVHLIDSVDGEVRDLIQRTPNPKVCFSPSSIAASFDGAVPQSDRVLLTRGVGPNSGIDLESAVDLPPDGFVFIDSPSDPLGSILLPTDAVRLARACQLVVVDERFGELSNFSLCGVASEFQNFVILRSYEKWLGPAEKTCGWAIASPDLVSRFGLASQQVDPAAMANTIALFSDRCAIESAARMARQERSRLYRLLRKYSFFEPIPSWGPFMSTRVKVVSRDAVVRAFLDRGIRVHTPEEAGLEDFIRVSIGSRVAMERFRLALQDMGGDLLA
jgi:histidinol-phosphate/aromatic aminotransferase/cobyric acid decarboxylase-like protein